MAKPIFATGDVPSASQVNDWFVNTLFIRKSANESVTSSTTLQNDDQLAVTLGVGTWRVEAYLHATGSLGGDIRTAWTFAGTTSSVGRSCQGPNQSMTDRTNTTMRSSASALADHMLYGTDGVGESVIVEDLLLVVTGSGVLTLQWAQEATSVTATVVWAGSRLYATRVD